MIETRLYERLSALCPNVYPGAAPLGYKQPCIIYNRVSTDPTRDLDDDDDTAAIRFQIDTYSTTHKQAITLAKTVRSDLRAWDSNDIAVSYLDQRDFIDNTTDTQLFRRLMEFMIFCNDD